MLDTLCVGRRSTSGLLFGVVAVELWVRVGCVGCRHVVGFCGNDCLSWPCGRGGVLFSWCCPSPGALCGVCGGGVGVLFENCIVDASIFVVFKNFTGFCVSF